ncbi:hypothetical protein EDD18DRAFT_1357359 [Armillaria luteobubalina]|uniref:JmjC domain-containing protein n=1 Tax=Armillaria luteobubalina TaxID=153913 RepID=A0AA39PYV7_9AGAR|nr:hypothetical protein EDD18DRAFT_1357359 [Armillaria luteobubalina]
MTAELLGRAAFAGFTTHGAQDTDIFIYLKTRIDELPSQCDLIKSLLERCRCFALHWAKKHFSGQSDLLETPVFLGSSAGTFNKEARHLMMLLSFLDDLVASAHNDFGRSINTVACPFEVPMRGTKLEPWLKKLETWPELVEEAINSQDSGPQLEIGVAPPSNSTLLQGLDVGQPNDKSTTEDQALCDGLLRICRDEHVTGLKRKFLSLALEIRMMANGGRSEYLLLVEKLYEHHPQYTRLLEELDRFSLKKSLLYATTYLSPLVLFDPMDAYPTHFHMAQYGYKRASKHLRPPKLRAIEQHIWQHLLLVAVGSVSINQFMPILNQVFTELGGRLGCETEDSTFFPLPAVLASPDVIPNVDHTMDVDQTRVAEVTAEIPLDEQMDIDNATPEPAPINPYDDQSSLSGNDADSAGSKGGSDGTDDAYRVQMQLWPPSATRSPVAVNPGVPVSPQISRTSSPSRSRTSRPTSDLHGRNRAPAAPPKATSVKTGAASSAPKPRLLAPVVPTDRVTRLHAGHLPGPPPVYELTTQLTSRKRPRHQAKDFDKSVTKSTGQVQAAQSNIDPGKASKSLRELLPEHLKAVVSTLKNSKSSKRKRVTVKKTEHNERDEHSTSVTVWKDADRRFQTISFRLLRCGSESETGYLNAIKNVDINRTRIADRADPVHLTDPTAALVQHMNHATYISLGSSDIQEILENQSILVYGLPDVGSNVEFDERGLEVLGALGEYRSIQSFSRRELYGHAECHLPESSHPSLNLILDEARRGEYGQVLNALEFPLGGTVLKALPNYEGVASDRSSFERTKNVMMSLAAEQKMGDITPYPSHAMSWGLCGLATSSTHQHRDSHGLPTHVSPLCGSKIWVLLRHSDKNREDCNRYRDYLDLRFDKDEDIEKYFESEVLYLDNATHLIMQPNVLHYVLTLEHSVAYGGHFIPSTGIKSVIIGFVHTALLTYSITNTLHPEIKRLLFRMMINWCFHGTTFRRESTDPHVPNWMEPKGLLDVIALGNLVLYAPALEATGGLEADQAALLEWVTARDAYIIAVAAFQRTFRTIGIADIFLESAKRFGASLYDYMTTIEEAWELHPDSAGRESELFEKALGDALDFDTAKEVLGVVSIGDGAASPQDFEGMSTGHWKALGSACESAGLHHRRGSRCWLQGTLRATWDEPTDDFDDTPRAVRSQFLCGDDGTPKAGTPTSNQRQHFSTTPTPSTPVYTAAGPYGDTTRIIFMVLLCIVPSPTPSFLSTWHFAHHDDYRIVRASQDSRRDVDSFGTGHGCVVDRPQASSTIKMDDFDAHQR